MKSIALIFLSAVVLFQTNLATKAQQKWYRSQNDKLYYIDENYESTWHEAFLKCSIMKMSLLTVETLEEHEELAKILKEDNFAFKGPHLWIGATGVNKQFAWIASSQHVFTTHWVHNNPDNWNHEENCLHFWENTTQLNDRKCDYKYGFICEESPSSKDIKTKYTNFAVNIISGK